MNRKLEVYIGRDLARLRSQSGTTDSYEDEVPESQNLARLVGCSERRTKAYLAVGADWI